MNLIICDQKCRHQKEGYCTLNSISKLTSDASAICGYYEAPKEEKKTLPQHAERL